MVNLQSQPVISSLMKKSAGSSVTVLFLYDGLFFFQNDCHIDMSNIAQDVYFYFFVNKMILFYILSCSSPSLWVFSSEPFSSLSTLCQRLFRNSLIRAPPSLSSSYLVPHKHFFLVLIFSLKSILIFLSFSFFLSSVHQVLFLVHSLLHLPHLIMVEFSLLPQSAFFFCQSPLCFLHLFLHFLMILMFYNYTFLGINLKS